MSPLRRPFLGIAWETRTTSPRKVHRRAAGATFLDRPRWLSPAFEILEDRRLLTLAQDLVDDIAPYQQAITSALNAATQLPLVGNQLTGLAEFATLLQNSESSIASQTQAITTSGHYQINVPLPSLSKTFGFNLGLDAFLQAAATGNVQAAINPVLMIGFDYNAGTGSVSLDITQTSLDIGFDVSLPGFQGTFSFNGLLFTKAVDTGTNFHGDLVFDFAAANSVDVHFSGDAHVRLGL